MRVCRSAPPTRRQQSSICFQVNEVHLLSRVFTVSGICLSLALLSLPLFSQTSLDTDPLNEPRVSGIGESRSEGRSPYVISVSHLRVPGKAASHLEAAQKRFAKMQLVQATMEVDRAIEIYPGFAQAFCMKALVQLAAKDFTGSVESAAHAISLDGADAYSWIALATAFNSLNEWPEAEAAAGRALTLNALAWQGQLELAKSFYGQGKFGLALNTLDQVSQNVPDIPLVRANSLVHLGRPQEAARQFSVFLQEAPSDSRVEQIREILSRMPAAQN